MTEDIIAISLIVLMVACELVESSDSEFGRHLGRHIMSTVSSLLPMYVVITSLVIVDIIHTSR